jgi:hypothetical protein
VQALGSRRSKSAPSSSFATLPSFYSAGDPPRRSQRTKKRKADADASADRASKRPRVDDEDESSEDGEQSSQDSEESNRIPSDDGWRDVGRTAEQIQKGNHKAALARFKCPVDGCETIFKGTATDTGTVVQPVLRKKKRKKKL